MSDSFGDAEITALLAQEAATQEGIVAPLAASPARVVSVVERFSVAEENFLMTSPITLKGYDPLNSHELLFRPSQGLFIGGRGGGDTFPYRQVPEALLIQCTGLLDLMEAQAKKLLPKHQATTLRDLSVALVDAARIDPLEPIGEATEEEVIEAEPLPDFLVEDILPEIVTPESLEDFVEKAAKKNSRKPSRTITPVKKK